MPKERKQDEPGEAGLSESMIRSQLERILASEIFSRSDRLRAFLKFTVERTLDGAAGTLKEQVLGMELYSKGPDFDAANSIGCTPPAKQAARVLFPVRA
jgi:hypothetical protein